MKTETPEVWVDIPNYEGFYQVSTLGRVRGLDRTTYYADGRSRFSKGQILTPAAGRKGYLRVVLCANGKQLNHFVHKLVCISFLEKSDIHTQVNHKNGVQNDNRLENLEWVTRQENMTHAAINNLTTKGVKHGMSKLTDADVIQIRKLASEKSMTQREIASKFGIACGYIDRIVNRRNWTHI